MNSLNGKIALVTGSSRGIGAEIATVFARRGASVAVHGREEAAVIETAEAIAGLGGTAVPVTEDVTDFAAVEEVRRRVEEALGPVDILVANAGGNLTPPAMVEDIPEDGWRATVDGNLLATFLTLKSFLPGMKARRRGCVITIASTAGRRAHPGSPAAYAAAKAGIALLTQDVAAQAGPSGVRANCLAPETILTSRNRERIPAQVQSRLAGEHPLKRLGTPEDVAAAAAFLASDDAAWITGVVIDVAGGAVMALPTRKESRHDRQQRRNAQGRAATWRQQDDTRAQRADARGPRPAVPDTAGRQPDAAHLHRAQDGKDLPCAGELCPRR